MQNLQLVHFVIVWQHLELFWLALVQLVELVQRPELMAGYDHRNEHSVPERYQNQALVPQKVV